MTTALPLTHCLMALQAAPLWVIVAVAFSWCFFVVCMSAGVCETVFAPVHSSSISIAKNLEQCLVRFRPCHLHHSGTLQSIMLQVVLRAALV
jgi:hypothetical protein